MPLQTAQDPSSLASFSDINADFVILYSSRDDAGKMWCPDCRDVEDQINRTFTAPGARSGVIVYVGQRAEWKTPSNPFRGAPWNVSSIPTIIRIAEAKESGRLVESEIATGLADFVQK